MLPFKDTGCPSSFAEKFIWMGWSSERSSIRRVRSDISFFLPLVSSINIIDPPDMENSSTLKESTGMLNSDFFPFDSGSGFEGASSRLFPIPSQLESPFF